MLPHISFQTFLLASTVDPVDNTGAQDLEQSRGNIRKRPLCFVWLPGYVSVLLDKSLQFRVTPMMFYDVGYWEIYGNCVMRSMNALIVEWKKTHLLVFTPPPNSGRL